MSIPLYSPLPDFYTLHAFREKAHAALPDTSDAWKCRHLLTLGQFYRLDITIVPKSKLSPANSFGVSFFNVNLSSDDRDRFSGWRTENAESWTTEFSQLIADGYKIGITWDDGNACFIASITGKVEGTPNFNCCITARSNDWLEALELLMFKHFVVCAAGTWSKHQTSVAWG